MQIAPCAMRYALCPAALVLKLRNPTSAIRIWNGQLSYRSHLSLLSFYQIPPFLSDVLSEKCSSLFLRNRKCMTAKTVKGG